MLRKFVNFVCYGYVSMKEAITGSDNGLSPVRHQVIIWTNAGLLSIGTLEKNFSEFLIAIQTLSFKKMHLKMLFGKWRLFCLGPHVIKEIDVKVAIWCGLRLKAMFPLQDHSGCRPTFPIMFACNVLSLVHNHYNVIICQCCEFRINRLSIVMEICANEHFLTVAKWCHMAT